MRQFLKGENGEKLLTTRSHRRTVFLVAEMIEREVGVSVSAVNTYDPVADAVMLGLHVLPSAPGVSEEQLAAMRRIWREFL